ncbi:MAG: NAD(P)-dependent oxidoreductase [Firmicutes bacterium]|nr:NAD(P)-dependent oxidoreductase [Bacillota bacterium]
MSGRTPTVAWIGCGTMGEPMAKHLLQAGYALVVVPHRHEEAIHRLVESGAMRVETAAEAASTVDLVFTMVPDAPQVEEVLFGAKGIVAGAHPGLTVIDCSTIAPQAARRFADRLQEAGIAFLDSPVSGGQSRARSGTLTLMVGGSEEVFLPVQPVLQAFAEKIFYVGPVGSGQVVKMCNNLIGAILVLANSEALTLGVKEGVPAELLREVIGTATGANYQLEQIWPENVLQNRYTPGFKLDLMYKDLGIALSSADASGVPLFAGALARQLYQFARSNGLGEQDYSVVSTVYQQAAGILIATSKPYPIDKA